MASGRVPNASEVLDLLDRLRRSESDRGRLYAGWDIYGAAVADGVIDRDGINWLAQRMQELHTEQLIAFASQSGGSPPLPPVWSKSTIQQLHDWRVTAAGRADALVYGRHRAQRRQCRSRAGRLDDAPCAGRS
jgi:hypothetical protein